MRYVQVHRSTELLAKQINNYSDHARVDLFMYADNLLLCWVPFLLHSMFSLTIQQRKQTVRSLRFIDLSIVFAFDYNHLRRFMNGIVLEVVHTHHLSHCKIRVRLKKNLPR